MKLSPSELKELEKNLDSELKEVAEKSKDVESKKKGLLKEKIEDIKQKVYTLMEQGKGPEQSKQMASWIWNRLDWFGAEINKGYFYTLFKDDEKVVREQDKLEDEIHIWSNPVDVDGDTVEKCSCGCGSVRINGVIFKAEKAEEESETTDEKKAEQRSEIQVELETKYQDHPIIEHLICVADIGQDLNTLSQRLKDRFMGAHFGIEEGLNEEQSKEAKKELESKTELIQKTFIEELTGKKVFEVITEELKQTLAFFESLKKEKLTPEETIKKIIKQHDRELLAILDHAKKETDLRNKLLEWNKIQIKILVHPYSQHYIGKLFRQLAQSDLLKKGINPKHISDNIIPNPKVESILQSFNTLSCSCKKCGAKNDHNMTSYFSEQVSRIQQDIEIEDEIPN